MEENNEVDKSEIHSLIINLFKNRQSFRAAFSKVELPILTVMAVLNFIFPCCFKKNTKFYSKMKIYQNGIKRYYHELDIVSLLKAVRLSKLLFATTLAQR